MKTFFLTGYLNRPFRDDGYVTPAGIIQMNFTTAERTAALTIAKQWLKKGWKPVLRSKMYDGTFQVLLNWKNFEKKRAA